MRNIVIVVDVQKGFAQCGQTVALTEKIANLLKRGIFDIVVATKFTNEKDSMYEKMFRWEKLETEEERAIPAEILKHVDYIAEKYIYNCVNASFIQRLCQLNGGEYPKKVFLVGADTDCCVLTIATSLFENNIRPIVLTRYVDSNGGVKSHEAGLLCMRRLIGEKQLTDIDPCSVEELDAI